MMIRKVLGPAGIIVFSVFLAFLTNYFRSDGLPLLRPKAPLLIMASENSQREDVVSLQVFREKQSEAIILDARSPDEFGKGHVPVAKNFPYDEFSERSPGVLKDIPFDREIVTYCEGINCSMAEDLAILLRGMGYQKVKVFAGGWEEWTKNKMPVEKKETGDNGGGDNYR